MKQFLLFTLLSLFTLISAIGNAQSNTLTKPAHLWQQKKMRTVVQDIPPVNMPAPSNENLPVFNRTDTETLIGTTVYDLQTNSSTMPRLFNFGNGSLSAVWTMGFDSNNGYPDRGAGYNHFNGSDWLPNPTERLEANIRTGWPCIVGTADGDEVIVDHIFQAPLRLHELQLENGSSSWTENDIPNSTTSGIVWPRIGVGGPDGNTIHAVAITSPVGNGGTIYEGVDGHLLYYRSLDGGDTWDIQDMIIPGLDNTTMSSGSPDDYAIDVRGETVVIASFGQFSDVAIVKSTDNGETWTRSVAKEFPIPNYVIDQGYTIDDLPPFTENQPDSLAILTADGSGAVIIDNNDMVHLFYGQMYVLDEDLTDAAWTFFPGTSGISYWNESYGADSIRVIADVFDANDNDVLDVASIDDIPTYFLSLTSHPSVGIDASNNLFLVYSSLMEEHISINATPNQQHVRHIFATASSDGGETWTEPYNIINEDIVSEPDLIPNTEAVFPSVARHVDSQVHFIYQFDFEPGLSVQGDTDPAGTNFISYVALDTETFGIVNTQEVINEQIDFQVYPNPVADVVNISFNVSQSADFKIGLYDLMGKELKIIDFETSSAGSFTHEMDLNEIPNGTYFIKLMMQEGIGIQKVVKH